MPDTRLENMAMQSRQGVRETLLELTKHGSFRMKWDHETRTWAVYAGLEEFNGRSIFFVLEDALSHCKKQPESQTTFDAFS